MRPSMVPLAVCLPLALYSAASLSASIYQWIDSNGITHYAQSPPDHAAYRRINPDVAPPTSAPGVAGIEKLSQNYDAETAAQNKAREAALKTKAQNAEVCAKARQRISQLQTSTAHRLFVAGADGSRRRMTEAEFKQRQAQAQSRADASCSN